MTAILLDGKTVGFNVRGSYPKGEPGNTYRTALATLLWQMNKDRLTSDRVFNTYRSIAGESDISLEESPKFIEKLTNGLYEAHISPEIDGPYRNSMLCLRREENDYWVATLDGKSYQDGPANLWNLDDQEVLAVLEVRKVEK